jgi:diadenosine tetraphosphate (Ap4A) HIT family hydrolase
VTNAAPRPIGAYSRAARRDRKRFSSLHVLPRFVGDGFGLKLGPQHRRDPGRPALDAAAAQIRASL